MNYVQNARRSQYEIVSKFISHNEIDGLIVLSGAITAHYGTRNTIKIIKSIKNMPIVSIALEVPEVTSVLVDNEMGITALFDHLHLQHSCTRIAFVKGPNGHDEADCRFNTYCNCLQKAGLPFDPDLIAGGTDFTVESGYQSATSLFKRDLHHIDAIMAVDDVTAQGVLKKLEELNISVPEEIIVTGFDNLDKAIYSVPSLTTVIQPFFEQGVEAARSLLNLILNKKTGTIIKLPTTIIIRNSCGCSLPNKQEKSKDASSNAIIINIKDLDNIQQQKLKNLKKIIHSEKSTDSSFETPNIIITIKKMIFKDYKNSQNLSYWQYVLDQCHQEMRSIESDHLITYRLYKQMLQIYFHYRELESIRNESLNNYHRNDLNFLSHQILSTFKQKELFTILQEKLPSVKIDRFYLILYDQKYSYSETLHWKDTPPGTLKVAYSSGVDIIKKYKNMKISHNSILQPYIWKKEEGKSLIFMPLSFNKEHYGYIIFNLNKQMLVEHYEMLRISIGNALHSCMLMERLENNVQQKTNFFINIAHEMKTPVTLISSYLDSYLKNPIDLNNIKVAQENINKLKRDMKNFLDSEKLQRGEILYNDYSQLNLSTFITKKVAAFNQIALESGVSINWNYESDIYINIDPSAMDRVFNNLLDNGIRYNKANGIININLKSSSGKIILEISNTGTPIPNRQKNRVFEPFFQISQKKRNDQGIGMGLNIVKKIIDDLDGSIKLTSTEHLTTFTIIFVQKKMEEKQVSTIKNYIPEDPIKSSEIPIIYFPYSPEKKNILLIDDSRQMITFLKNQMNQDYNVYYAFSGKEALKLIGTIPEPDLIICDIMMDDMNGFQYFEEISKHQDQSYTPFLFLSAKTGAESRIKALEMGAADYISKPFELTELLIKVKNMLKVCDKQKELANDNIKNKFFDFLEQQTQKHDVYAKKDNVLEKLFSSRELDIIHQLEEGKLYKEIAYEFDISINTVKTYIKRIYKKVEVNNRVELLRLFNWPHSDTGVEKALD